MGSRLLCRAQTHTAILSGKKGFVPHEHGINEMSGVILLTVGSPAVVRHPGPMCKLGRIVSDSISALLYSCCEGICWLAGLRWRGMEDIWSPAT